MSKIFGIGFHKTGTTTLDEVFQILGYNACPVRTDLSSSLAKGDLATIFEVVRSFDAFQDNPWPIIYQELDEEFPGSKFILTCRNDEKWLKSAINQFVGKKKREMRELIYGEGNSDPSGIEDLYLARYQQHNREVREYFKDRPNDFLEVWWEKGHGWDELCNFLGKPLPEQPFPHSNKGNYTKKKKGFFSFLK